MYCTRQRRQHVGCIRHDWTRNIVDERNLRQISVERIVDYTREITGERTWAQEVNTTFRKGVPKSPQHFGHSDREEQVPERAPAMVPDVV